MIVEGPLPAGELARRLRLTTGVITHMIDRLSGAGLMVRATDPGDRRRVLIEAAPGAGERMTDRYRRLDARTRETLGGFDTEEQEVIAKFIERSLRVTRDLVDGD